MNSQPTYRFSVCICTRHRPEDLSRAIDSVYASSVPISQIIVSDDSEGNETAELVASRYKQVEYVRGPRKGLGANRNCAASRATGTHLLFLDDDALIGPSFFSLIFRELESLPAAEQERTILSGIENINGDDIFPSDLGFLGFLDRPRARESRSPLLTSVINATVFPRKLFTEIGFDSNLVYGCDEIDITTKAVAFGYRIDLLPGAVNLHLQSPIHRGEYASFVHASRLYVTFKLYFFIRRNYLRAFSFAGVAVLHLIAHNVKTYGSNGLLVSYRALSSTLRYLLRYTRGKTDSPPLIAKLGAGD